MAKPGPTSSPSCDTSQRQREQLPVFSSHTHIIVSWGLVRHNNTQNQLISIDLSSRVFPDHERVKQGRATP